MMVSGELGQCINRICVFKSPTQVLRFQLPRVVLASVFVIRRHAFTRLIRDIVAPAALKRAHRRTDLLHAASAAAAGAEEEEETWCLYRAAGACASHRRSANCVD